MYKKELTGDTIFYQNNLNSKEILRNIFEVPKSGLIS